MRVTNIDTLSAYLDRLITENIKLYFFNKDNLADKVAHQKIVIEEIKTKISELFLETLERNSYNYIEEHRTFNESAIVEELEELIQNDINIGEADRARLEETTKETPNLDRMIVNEKRLRKANEGRARNKNNIDKLFKGQFNNEA
jgi:uncharacterized membrane protein